jgi:putative ABC transport system ATP-binding protein
MDQRGVEVCARSLSHAYKASDGNVSVLRELDLLIPAGGYCTLQGESGAGKTTLLSLLGGLERPQAGDLRVGPYDLASLRGDALAAYRRTTVGFVFQHFGLLAALTALENVELPATLAGEPPRRRRPRACELLDAVGLTDRYRHYPAQLSGGERQRVAMARALMNRPRLLLADEPTGNLDHDSGLHVIELLESLHRGWGFTLIVVTHNDSIAERAPQRLLLRNGRVQAAAEVLS